MIQQFYSSDFSKEITAYPHQDLYMNAHIENYLNFHPQENKQTVVCSSLGPLRTDAKGRLDIQEIYWERHL